jgi:hypothetical protein
MEQYMRNDPGTSRPIVFNIEFPGGWEGVSDESRILLRQSRQNDLANIRLISITQPSHSSF